MADLAHELVDGVVEETHTEVESATNAADVDILQGKKYGEEMIRSANVCRRDCTSAGSTGGYSGGWNRGGGGGGQACYVC